jgi:hypothetical protein
MKGADKTDPLAMRTASDDFEAIDELVDEENRETSRKHAGVGGGVSARSTKEGVLSKYLGNSNNHLEETEIMESPLKEYNRIKGEDRIYNKPMKVFTKNGNKIKRATVEKDALNIFEMVDLKKRKGGSA